MKAIEDNTHDKKRLDTVRHLAGNINLSNYRTVNNNNKNKRINHDD